MLSSVEGFCWFCLDLLSGLRAVVRSGSPAEVCEADLQAENELECF